MQPLQTLDLDQPYSETTHYVCPLCHNGLLIETTLAGEWETQTQRYLCPVCGLTPTKYITYGMGKVATFANDLGSVSLQEARITWTFGNATIPTPQMVWRREYHPMPTEAKPDAVPATP